MVEGRAGDSGEVPASIVATYFHRSIPLLLLLLLLLRIHFDQSSLITRKREEVGALQRKHSSRYAWSPNPSLARQSRHNEPTFFSSKNEGDLTKRASKRGLKMANEKED